MLYSLFQICKGYLKRDIYFKYWGLTLRKTYSYNKSSVQCVCVPCFYFIDFTQISEDFLNLEHRRGYAKESA